jgi:pimeloyl-ACP methyl ester carboxylesterase
MGSEASFHDLPAHIHDLLTSLLSDSHVVYTRIYPRYKSYGESGIRTAVDQFSAWYVGHGMPLPETNVDRRLAPHEADDLDIILLGHSLGGILAADVALLQQNEQPKHRILGLLNFDVPFLGLHPRVIPTGLLSSMPRKDVAAEDELAEEQQSLGMDPAYKPLTPSPNFDPPFRNDHRLVQRGFFKGLMHFVNKNTDNLSRSMYDRVASSFKFAGCVNNYSELRRRYRRLVELENAEHSPQRVRFVNYYTASTGRIPRKDKTNPGKKTEDGDQIENPSSPPQEGSDTPSISKEDEAASSMNNLTLDVEESKGANPSSVCKEAETSSTRSKATPEEQSLKSATPDIRPSTQKAQPPPLPPRAAPTPAPDLQDSASEWIGSEPDRPSVDITSSSSSTPTLQDSQSLSGSVSLTTSDSGLSSDTSQQKLRKFILLPSHHWKRNDNAHWTSVLMENMDEVEAHQSMFIPHGANYDFLVGDTVALIEQWVQNDLSRRLMQESLD